MFLFSKSVSKYCTNIHVIYLQHSFCLLFLCFCSLPTDLRGTPNPTLGEAAWDKWNAPSLCFGDVLILLVNLWGRIDWSQRDPAPTRFIGLREEIQSLSVIS